MAFKDFKNNLQRKAQAFDEVAAEELEGLQTKYDKGMRTYKRSVGALLLVLCAVFTSMGDWAYVALFACTLHLHVMINNKLPTKRGFKEWATRKKKQ